MSVFDKWNKTITKEFMEGVKDAESGKGGNYVDVPFGKYEVSIKTMELKESSKGDPMVQVIFKILAGEYKGQTILMNQVIAQPFQIHIANEFLRSLDVEVDIEFKDYSQYNDVILDVMERVREENLEYALKYSQNEKGYSVFEIVEVFSEF